MPNEGSGQQITSQHQAFIISFNPWAPKLIHVGQTIICINDDPSLVNPN